MVRTWVQARVEPKFPTFVFPVVVVVVAAAAAGIVVVVAP